jgi:hypothetical protein
MDPTAIRDQIDRILRSQTFASKSQLRKLLEILFKHMDSQTTLTPGQVIKELWPEETRTKRSADVATEMNRLRHALESYYNGEGKTDPITIILPNRAAPATDGTQEKRWIVAKPRAGTEDGAVEDHPPGSQVNSREWLKKIIPIAMLSTAVGMAVYISIRVLAVHHEPKLGQLDGSTLRIMDAQGKELWRKTFPGGFGPDSYYAQGLASRIWFADLEGKGHASVLFSYLPVPDSKPHSSTLIPAGSLVTASVEQSSDIGEYGRGAKAQLRFKYVVLPDGTQLPLRGIVDLQGKSKNKATLAAFAVIRVGVLSITGAGFAIPAGALFHVEVAGEQKIRVGRATAPMKDQD